MEIAAQSSALLLKQRVRLRRLLTPEDLVRCMLVMAPCLFFQNPCLFGFPCLFPLQGIRDGETTIKIKFALLRGVLRGGHWGQRGKSFKNAVFLGKRHDNKILKLQILLSRNVVVIAQAPKEFLAILSVFPFFPKDFRRSAAKEVLVFLLVFLAVFQKGKEKKIR